MNSNAKKELTLKLDTNSSPEDFRIVMAILRLTQNDIAKHFAVTQGAISQAIRNDRFVKKLRERIINYLNLLQSDTKTKEVA